MTEVERDVMQENKVAAEQGWMDPLPGVHDAFEVVGQSEIVLEVVEPTPLNDDTPPEEEQFVELDPDAAEHELSHAAQDVVEFGIKLIHGAKSDIFVRKEDMANLRRAVEAFELAYAKTITVGKLIGLAQAVEQQPTLGQDAPIVDAQYDGPETSTVSAGEALMVGPGQPTVGVEPEQG